MHSNNKNLEKIYQIIIFTEVSNLAKSIPSKIAELTMMITNSQSDRQIYEMTNKHHFEYSKNRHYIKNYCLTSKKKLFEEEKTVKKSKTDPMAKTLKKLPPLSLDSSYKYTIITNFTLWIEPLWLERKMKTKMSDILIFVF